MVPSAGGGAALVEAAAATVVVMMGAVRSGSVILVSWDVLMVELSKRELASGERDRQADAGGESLYTAYFVSP